MQKFLLLTALVFSLISAAGIYSQTKFQLQFYGSYNLPASDLEGTFPDTLSSNNRLDFNSARTLLTKKGFGFGTAFKFIVDTVGSARLNGGIAYSSFSGSKEYTIPFKPTRIYTSNVSIFTITAGAEYMFNPQSKMSPLFGLDLAANFFGGSIKSKGDTAFTLDRSQETRLGVTATAGLNVAITKKINIVFGVKYSLANLIGKKTETISTTTTNTNTDIGETGEVVSFELPLNDAASGRNEAKSFNYFHFFTGVSFGFGQPLKK